MVPNGMLDPGRSDPPQPEEPLDLAAAVSASTAADVIFGTNRTKSERHQWHVRAIALHEHRSQGDSRRTDQIRP
jgi:hypothetical protein